MLEGGSQFPLQGDLPLVRDMGGDPGDEFQEIHLLRLVGFFPIPIGDLAWPFIQGEPLQGEKGPDHVFPDPLGLLSGLGPDAAVNIEPRVPPGQKAVRPIGAQQLLVDQKPKNLPGEEFCQARVVYPGDLLEDPGLVTPPLVTKKWRWGWKLMRSPKVWMAAITPGRSSLPVTAAN